MNVRKIALIVACLLSGVAAFLPFYFIQVGGQTIEDGALSIMPSFYGIGIVATAILTIGFGMFGMRKGYIITALINAGCSFYSCYRAYLGTETAKYSLRMAEHMSTALYSGQAQTESMNIEIVTGPGFILLIIAAILVLLMMFWNVVGPDED